MVTVMLGTLQSSLSKRGVVIRIVGTTNILIFTNVNFDKDSATDKVGVIPLKNFRIQRKLF